jgi:hypothetical protein
MGFMCDSDVKKTKNSMDSKIVGWKSFFSLVAPLGLLFSLEAAAQRFARFPVEVIVDGRNLPLAAVGGLNNPQLSAVDLNGNGTLDLYVFDRAGNVQLAFLNEGGRWVYAPEYLDNFPPLINWVLLRDYNGAGVMDCSPIPPCQASVVSWYTPATATTRVKSLFDATTSTIRTI